MTDPDPDLTESDLTAPDLTTSDLTEQLRTVEQEIAQVRQSVTDLRAQVGGRGDGATDPEDTAAAIRSADEQETLAGVLETRRDALKARLAASR